MAVNKLAPGAQWKDEDMAPTASLAWLAKDGGHWGIVDREHEREGFWVEEADGFIGVDDAATTGKRLAWHKDGGSVSVYE